MGEPTDSQLLKRFASRQDEAAFAALVRRHGPMVLGVCRRILRNAHDADDAFQVTFFVLVRKARTIARPELLGNWLYGVASRVAVKARNTAARRSQHERRAPAMVVVDPLSEVTGRELRAVLDAELSQLPGKYRTPLVLCYLEGKTNEQAARMLGWPTGSMSGRLARGRELLRERLLSRRRGSIGSTQSAESVAGEEINKQVNVTPQERRAMGSSCIRRLYPCLAIIALMVLDQAAGHAQVPHAPSARMSRPQRLRAFAMPSFSPNPSVNLGMIPMLGAYGIARPMQSGRAYSYGSYGAGIPYAGSGSRGGSQGYTQGYRGGEEAAPAASGEYTAEPQPDHQAKNWSSLLTAAGVPNDNGQLRWPLGLRILAAPETDKLREQIDALFEEAASQTAGGPVSSPLIQQTVEAVMTFRRLLLKDKAVRFGMPLTVYNESERFLNQLEYAAQVLKSGLQGPGGRDQLETAAPPASSPPKHTPPAKK